MQNEKYSNELNRLLTFMEEKLIEEMPTAVFNLDYFILAILNQKDSFIYRRLDDNLTQMTLDTLFNAYYQLVDQKKLTAIRPNREIAYDSKFQKALSDAEKQRDILHDDKITSEHVFLALLSDDAEDDKSKKIFNKAGIEYNILLEKITDNKNEEMSEEPQEPQHLNLPPGATVMHFNVPEGEDPQAYINNILQNQMGFNVNEQKETNKKGSTKAINTYCTNLNKLANEGKIDKLVGRENEVNAIVRVLGRRKKNNVILVGDSGSGKSAIASGIACLIEEGNVPPLLYGKKIVSLDMTAIIAGTTLRGMFEERVKALLDELKANKTYILLIDDIDSVLAQRTGGNDYDISAMLSHALDNGEIQVIGTSDYKGYRNTFDKNPSLARKFQKVIVDAPTKAEATHILYSIKEYYEKFHNVSYPKETIDECVSLAEKYITERNLPDSAIDILDEVGSYKSINNQVDERINKLRQNINDIKKQISTLKKKDNYEEADSLSNKEREMTIQLIDANKEYEEKKKKSEPTIITPDDIMEIISMKTKIPISKLSVNDKHRIANMNDRIKEEVIGQDEAVDEVCKVIKRNRVGLRSGRTYGTLLLLGKSGVGKTLLAKKVAKEVFGDEDALVRFDMSEYSDKTSVNKLIGASAGYVGYEEGGVMTERIKNKKHCVILLDEIEKADKEVYNMFLQVFDEGFLTDNTGQKIDFKNTIIMLTSNVGVRTANEFGTSMSFNNNKDENVKRILSKELKREFPPEFLNRLDGIIYFNNLTDENLKNIIKIEVNKVKNRLIELGFDMEYTEQVVDYILNVVKDDKEFGARPVIRAIQSEIEDKITDLLLENSYDNGHSFSIDVENDHITTI